MNASNKQPRRPDELLTVKDVMDVLRITKSSVYRLVEKRLIRHYKLGAGLRFKMLDVQAYLDGCCREVINNEYVYGSKEEKR